MSGKLQPAQRAEFVLCLRNEGYAASLEVRKVYPLLPTTPREHDSGFVRVIDESGEDYLYPAGFFLALDLPEDVGQALLKAA